MSLSARDQQIINYLKKFKVMSRDQLAYLVCQKNSLTNGPMKYPEVTINRILKRLTLNGWIKSIPRERDKTNCYTLAESTIKSGHNYNHYLKIVDTYIQRGCPKHFAVEPEFGIYKPDAYMIDQKSNKAVCIEVQLTQISIKKMQQKINQFVAEYDKHKSNIFYLVTDHEYTKLKIDEGFHIYQVKVPVDTKLIKPNKKATL